VNNGTSATHLLYKALKFRYPSLRRIYVPNNVFVAVWNAALYEYPASMLSVLEMDPATLNMRVDEAYIRTLEPNSAVVVVHNVGNVVDVPRLQQIRPDLVFVEDACEAFLEQYGNRVTGSASLCAAVSFFANKIITSGEGGIWYTNDRELYEFVYATCHHGMTHERYIYNVLGYNYRMTNVQAALLYAQMEDIDAILARKREVARRYKVLFGDAVATTGLWMMVLRLPGTQYAELLPRLAMFGVDTRPMFYDIHRHKHLRAISSSASGLYTDDICMVPSSPSLTVFDQVFIENAVRQAIRGTYVPIVRATRDSLGEFLCNPMPETFRYFAKRSIQDSLAAHTLTLLAMDGDSPIGYAHIDDRWVGLCVLPSSQAKGVGTALLTFVISYARLAGIPLRLSVDKTNARAISLYRRHGFRTTRETETVYFMDLE
jgi:perosamine synthetase